MKAGVEVGENFTMEERFLGDESSIVCILALSPSRIALGRENGILNKQAARHYDS